MRAGRESRPGTSNRKLARLEGFEPPTNGFGSHYSIRLSYRRPAGYCPQSRPAARVAYALPMSYERFHPAPVPPWRERLGLYWKLTRGDRRSEEHTSELPSLMRISYAVFCLKKKKQHKHPT